ncbi:MAG: hypothetical protein IEMM0007_1680 [bacterium]|nr:MAG: hypothetical protein IEMM0007_1680 [bacterium]
MKGTRFKIFMGVLILLFAGLWITGCTEEMGSMGMKHGHNHDSADETEVVAVAGGAYHSIELKSDGTVWAWGRNSDGQLGDGTTIDSPAPIQVNGLTDVTAISAGAFHTIALKTDGTVWAWGRNKHGQLGDGTTIDSPAPIQVNGLTDVTAISAGAFHTIALKTDGTVWAWGRNRSGQLGAGTRDDSATPVQVSGLTDVTAIAAGNSSTIALKADGTVWSWGDNWVTPTPAQVSGLRDVTAISAGAYHMIALKTDGTVWAWKYNAGGQLGDGTTTSRTTPVQVSGLTNVTAIVAGRFHTIAIKADGTVWAWGSNELGQLGVATTETCEAYVGILEAPGYIDPPTFCSTTPVQVSGLTDIVAIAAGGYHSIALESNNTEWAWGYNEDSQLGATTTETCGYEDEFDCSPIPVPVRSKVTGTFSVGGTVSSLTGTLVLQNNGGDDLIITENGPFTFATELEDLDIYDITVLSQPFDQTCSLISGRINAADVTDIEIKCFTFVDIAAGNRYSLALETDGTVWAWGYGELGQLGNGAVSSYSKEVVQVSNLTDINAVAAGFYHSLALKTDGTVWAWGRNELGQLGATTTERCQADNLYACSTTPIKVSGLTDITRIAGGGFHSIALKSDGTVWAWGSNELGQLGDGTTIDSPVPIKVSGLTDITRIAGGGFHSIALKSDGTVWAWGNNYFGQLGATTTETCGSSTPCSTTPIKVSGLTDITRIAGGGFHSIALKSDGTVWAWGSNELGQLGDGTRDDSATPVQVSGLTDVTAIAAGHGSTIALKADGTVWSWGSNYYHQLGIITTETCGPPYPCSTTPVEINGLTDVSAIAGGDKFTLLLKTDGTVWETNITTTVPIQIVVTP